MIDCIIINFVQKKACCAEMYNSKAVSCPRDNAHCWQHLRQIFVTPSLMLSAAQRQVYRFCEADNGHGIHSFPEGFAIIYFTQAEGLAASQIVERAPARFKPACQCSPSDCGPGMCLKLLMTTCQGKQWRIGMQVRFFH